MPGDVIFIEHFPSNSQFFNEIVTHQDVDDRSEKINFKKYVRALIRKTKVLN